MKLDIKKMAPLAKTLGLSAASLGTGAFISNHMAEERLKKQKAQDDYRSKKQVKTFIKAIKKLEAEDTQRKTAMSKDRLFKLAMDEGEKKEEKKDEKKGDEKASGKYVTPGFLMNLKNKKKEEKDAPKEKDKEKESEEYKEQEKEAFDKLGGYAGKVLKGLALAGGGAAAGAYGMGKKKDDERSKDLKKIKYMNTIENKYIKSNLAKQFKSYNDKENKALAKHFYNAGKNDGGK